MKPTKWMNLVLVSSLFAITAHAAPNKEFSNLDTDLTKISESLQSGTEDDQGRECKLTVLHASEGPSNESMVISIESSKHAQVSILVSNQDKISSHSIGDKVDFKKVYEIYGIGSVTITSVEDAYDEVTVSDEKTSLTCGVYR